MFFEGCLYALCTVKRKNSTALIFFDTQKEAIAYAKTVAGNQEGNIVIHKVDGKIRKQDYSKPAVKEEKPVEKPVERKRKRKLKNLPKKPQKHLLKRQKSKPITQ